MAYKIGSFTVAGVIGLLVFAERPAFAYVDPGSGLLVCQSVGAMFAGAMYYFRRRLKGLFGKSKVSQERP